MTLTKQCQTADDIIEQAILELRRNRDQICKLLPCKVTIHLPPEGSRDPPCVEVNAKLKPRIV